MTTSRSREAFAAAEERAWAHSCERWVPCGGLVPCAEPEPLPVYQEPARTRHPEFAERDVVLGDGGGCFAYPLISQAQLPEDPRARKYLTRWAGMGADDRAPFLTRAGRHLLEANHKKFLEYAGYCLFARGRIQPVSLGVFQKFQRELNKTNGLRATKGRNRT